MAVLQHELQHVLDYRQGGLTALRYLTGPRHWGYDCRPTGATRWEALGFEQRGALAERLWLAERGLGPAREIAGLQRLIPWT